MKKIALAMLCLGLFAAAMLATDEAQARGPCPPGYFWDGPYGCMPYGPPPPPPVYYNPYYPRACPPGTVWDYGACRPVMMPPPPPPPRYGITIDVPPIIIR